MTAGAPAPVRLYGYSEVIQHIFFAHPLLDALKGFPGPVIGLVNLQTGLGVTGQTGPGYLRPCLKILLQNLEFCMIGRGQGNLYYLVLCRNRGKRLSSTDDTPNTTCTGLGIMFFIINPPEKYFSSDRITPI